MAVTDFDTIVDIIEEDIALGWRRVKTRINNNIFVSDRDKDAFFKVIDPEGKTIKKYYDFRRLCCAMNEFKRGDTTLDKLAEKYNFTDRSHLSNEIRDKLGEYPTDLLAENYECPKVQHLTDIMRNSGVLSMPREDKSVEIKEQIINHMKLNEDKYKSELISAIDNINALQNENEQLKAVIRREHIKEQSEGEQLNMSMLSREMYEEFLEIERCRAIYDFTSEDIIHLYHESVRTGKNLEELCIEADDNYAFDEPKLYDYELEKLAYMIEHEGDFEDMRREYFEDDDPADCEYDPYATRNWEDEQYLYKQYENEYYEIDEAELVEPDDGYDPDDYEFEEADSPRTSISYDYWKRIKRQLKENDIKSDSSPNTDKDIPF